MDSRPERLIPHHLGHEPEAIIQAQEEDKEEGLETEWPQTPAEATTAEATAETKPAGPILSPELRASRKEQHHLRKEALRQAPDLDRILKEQAKEAGRSEKEIESTPWSLRAVEDFQRIAREAQDLRKVLRMASSPAEKIQALRVYKERQEAMREYMDYGPPFEKAYREYINARREFSDFLKMLTDIKLFERMLSEPVFQSLGDNDVLDTTSWARLERVMNTKGDIATDENDDQEALLESLKSVFPEDSDEYREARRTLLSEIPVVVGRSKKELRTELVRLRKEAGDIWQDNSMVRYFYNSREMNHLLKAFTDGQDVIETQSIIHDLNKLHEWEQQHQRTTIGGVLVGPPGTGKTTRVHHYLEKKGRHYVYIDLSEDVTRYLLYGTKAVSFKSPTEYFQTLLSDLNRLDDASFEDFIRENAASFSGVFGLEGDQATVGMLGAIIETLDSEEVPESVREYVPQVKNKIIGLAESRFHGELATQFTRLVSSSRNGWRDGVITAALRRGDSILFDEFNKNKNWSLIYSLMTAKPGEAWYFADNDEYMQIPEDWRMYFTANIGSKHGTFEVPEALASRAEGKILEVDYTPPREEMQTALVAFSNPEGYYKRSQEDLARLFITIHELFPKIRHFLKGKRQSIPISYRTIRDLGEKLVRYRDPKTKLPVYEPTQLSFDEALYDILVEGYALYEDKSIPREVVNLATSMGLLLDDSVKSKVIGWITEETYNDRREVFDKNKKSFDEIVDKIRGMRDMADTMDDVMGQQ